MLTICLKIFMTLALINGRISADFFNITNLEADDTSENDSYGVSVAIHGSTIVVGSQYNEETGAAYIWEQGSDGNWTLGDKLVPADLVSEDGFGQVVAIYGETIVVGSENSQNGKGAAYVFSRVEGSWMLTDKLMASDAEEGDYFATSIAIYEKTIVIGASSDNSYKGSVYVYQKQANCWKEVQKLSADDAVAEDYFGTDVGIYHNTIIVGASDVNNEQGAAYIFQLSDGGWIQTNKITGSDGSSDEYFGSFVSIYGDTAAISTPYQSNAQGSVYIFQKTNGNWPSTETQKITAIERANNAQFGSSLAVYENRIVVGNPNHQSGNGMIHIFDKVDGTWTHMGNFTAFGRPLLGYSVALNEDSIISGAPQADNYSGTIYLYRSILPPYVMSDNVYIGAGQPFDFHWFWNNYHDEKNFPLTKIRIVKVGFTLKLGEDLVSHGQEIDVADLDELNYTSDKYNRISSLQWQSFNGYLWSESIAKLEIHYMKSSCETK